MVAIEDIEKAVAEAQQENSLFVNKAALDAFVGSGRLAGREGKAGELVRVLVGGIDQGYAQPFVFVYGRTGSGKSSVVKFVCESLPVAYRIVNLRRAQTVFGCAALVMAELGVSLKSGQGMGSILEEIEKAAGALADGRLFVLVLDEFDSLFRDARGRPSDFLYRLLAAQERLRAEGRLVTIVAVSNSVAPAEEMDDRVRSRMGSAPEIFFNAYSKDDVVAMLHERAKAALAEGTIDAEAIEYCAERCSKEHGDARRAIGLLRAAAEIAGAKGERRISKGHVDEAARRLDTNRVSTILRSSSYNLQMACCGLARVTYLAPELEWYATSTLYKQYCCCMPNNVEPLGYRRVSELLGELENLGLVVSRAVSKGKHGYGKQYRLTVQPDIVGWCFIDFWMELAKDAEMMRAQIEEYEDLARSIEIQEPGRIKARYRARDARIAWKRFVDL